jgi:membrane-associated protease RseP (regulator of RpoE activity)
MDNETLLFLLFLWLFSSFISGLLGLFIANNKGVDGVTGFIFGFLMPGIGLVITALLNPSKTVAPEKPKLRPSRPPLEKQSLSDPEYKLWLVSEYNIQRNDVLGEFLCRGKLFPTIDDALSFAHSVDVDRRTYGILAITAVQSGSAADKVGIKVGDKLISYNGQRCASSDDLKRAVQTSGKGSARIVFLLRNSNVIKRVVQGGILGVAGEEQRLTEAELLLAETEVAREI